MKDEQAKRINGYLELEIGPDWILVFKDDGDDGTQVIFPAMISPPNAVKILEGAAQSIHLEPQKTRHIET